jgi:hypothetical protein
MTNYEASAIPLAGHWWILDSDGAQVVQTESEASPEKASKLPKYQRTLPVCPSLGIGMGTSRLRISPPPGTLYRVVQVAAVPVGDTPWLGTQYDNPWRIFAGPFEQLHDAENLIPFLLIEYGCPLLVSWQFPPDMVADGKGRLRLPEYLIWYPELGAYPWGGALAYLLRTGGHWFPEGIARDWEPGRTKERLQIRESRLRTQAILLPDTVPWTEADEWWWHGSGAKDEEWQDWVYPASWNRPRPFRAYSELHF